MLLSESSCVCIPNFRAVTPLVCLTKVPFLSFYQHGNHFSDFLARVLR